ncbi:hypothetical protein J4228_02475 [Candidatus Woesearchaeota archaeon]|nr:hypothetical protein [Candidatus Woesearchaeota archaeon]
MKIQRVKFKDIEQIPKLQVQKQFKQDFYGSAPAPFIGRFGYPCVNIGILSPQFVGDMSEYDSPRIWREHNAAIGEIATKRYGLVNSRTTWNIKDVHQGNGRFFDIVQEVGMAKKAVDVEVSLTKPPTLSLTTEKEIIPFGPASMVRKARLTENTTVDSRVEKMVSDTDLKAAPALASLYKKGFEENTLSKLISVGNLGLKQNRKLVPTRWSITAVDDTIGKQLIAEIKDFPIGEYSCYFGGGWGNYYVLLFFPEIWSYELFETYLASDVNPWSKRGYMYSTDYEEYNGRKTYADETAGGYYACRLPVLEKLKELKRQGTVLALRFITSEYNIPLGVWVCREATRKSLAEKPLIFASEDEMLSYAINLIQNRFQFDLHILLKESRLLKQKKQQAKLTDF